MHLIYSWNSRKQKNIFTLAIQRNLREPPGTIALIELFQPILKERGRSFQGMKVLPLHDDKQPQEQERSKQLS